jgi:hypothetical protein
MRNRVRQLVNPAGAVASPMRGELPSYVGAQERVAPEREVAQ